MTPDEAVEVIARHILAQAAAEADWEDYPEIGQHDWDAIVRKVDQLAPIPARFGEALRILANRADQ